jgi:hypothetical protein
MIFVATKNYRRKNFSSFYFGAFGGYELWDPRSGMDENQDPGSGINIPDQQHCRKGTLIYLQNPDHTCMEEKKSKII